MLRVAGIDPGLSGALAVLEVHADGTQRVAVVPTPVAWVQVGNGKRRRYDAHALAQALGRLAGAGPPIALAYLEQQTARPGQGVSSTFSTGFGFGLWVGLLTAATIPYVVVAPPRWRARVGLRPEAASKARKEAVRVAACRRFPAVPINLDHADAVMLAVAAALEHGEGADDEARHDRPSQDVRPGEGAGDAAVRGGRTPRKPVALHGAVRPPG